MDGPPEEIVSEPKPLAGSVDVPEPPDVPSEPDEPDLPKRQRIIIKLAEGKERAVQHMTAIHFYDPSGRSDLG
jgi:type I restriction enzyme R subunit